MDIALVVFAASLCSNVVLLVALYKLCRDKLTGLWVRRLYEYAYSWYRSRAVLIFLDVDDFKSFNEKYGHRVGDNVLSLVGKVIRRNAGLLGFRFGGDEFALIVTQRVGESGEELRLRALTLAHEIHRQIGESHLNEEVACADSPTKTKIVPLHVTVTLSVALMEQLARRKRLLCKDGDKNRVIDLTQESLL